MQGCSTQSLQPLPPALPLTLCPGHHLVVLVLGNSLQKRMLNAQLLPCPSPIAGFPPGCPLSELLTDVPACCFPPAATAAAFLVLPVSGQQFPHGSAAQALRRWPNTDVKRAALSSYPCRHPQALIEWDPARRRKMGGQNCSRMVLGAAHLCA